MYLFGCLPVLLLIAVVMVFAIFGRTVEMLGATVIWLWDSFANLFRSAANQKRVFNPWTGKFNFDPLRKETYSSASSDAESSAHNKIYGPSDGEYIDFEEIV